MVKLAFHRPKSRRTVVVGRSSSDQGPWSYKIQKMLDHLKIKKISFYVEEVFLSVIILFNKGNYIHVNHYGVYENNCIRNQSVNMQMAHQAND